jgi:hypothetical protein
MLRIRPIIRFASDAEFRSVLFTPAGMTFMHIGVRLGLLVRLA